MYGASTASDCREGGCWLCWNEDRSERVCGCPPGYALGPIGPACCLYLTLTLSLFIPLALAAANAAGPGGVR